MEGHAARSPGEGAGPSYLFMLVRGGHVWWRCPRGVDGWWWRYPVGRWQGICERNVSRGVSAG